MEVKRGAARPVVDMARERSKLSTAEPTHEDGVPTYMPGADETGVLMQRVEASSDRIAAALPRSPCVVVLRGPDEGRVLRVQHGVPVVLGRGAEAQLELRDDGISRAHARITVFDDSRILLEDLGSRNGTFVNDRPVRVHQLQLDDLVRLGASSIVRVLFLDPLEEDLHRRLSSAASKDALTGVANRRHFDERLAGEGASARRHSRPLSMLFVDVDHFKKVNDTYGHATGDQVLRSVAEALAAGLRREDTLFRYGGEEFAVLARETHLPGAVVLGERLRRQVEAARIQVPGVAAPLQVTVSVGVAELGPDMSDQALLEAADRCVYTAKRSGRNRVVHET